MNSIQEDARHSDYVSSVALEQYPEDPEVPLPAHFSNNAGNIVNVLFSTGTLKVESVAIIESVAGAVRSNHYHKTDWHFMYVVSGRVEYYWRKVGKSGSPSHQIFNRGELMFTPPMIEHATFFPEPTVLLTIARNSRKHQDHEADVIRTKLIDVIHGKVVVCG